jgi:hypothetical protein
MVKTVALNTDIPASRELRIKLPADAPTGSAKLVITVSPSGSPPHSTFGDLLHSEIFGMWRDRADIEDSLEFAQKLRAEGWNRSPDEPC